MKIAVVVMVKDEAEDILPWLCWYIDLGVNTIFFFDDSSSDGTKHIAQAVGKIADVRVSSFERSIDFYAIRQRKCYKEILINHADEFDWIGFLDADEYLRLPSGQNLAEFLDRSDLVGAVAINWCNYGSGGNVLKPHMPAFWAYNQHYHKSKMENRHVKSFLRPKCWTGEWFNVHFFDVDPFLYDDVNGGTVAWSSIRGITAEEPVWDGGRVMHYQCRSMEHFVERVRKRPDIPAHPSLWASYDHAEVTDETPRLKYYSIALIMRTVVQEAIKQIAVSFWEQVDFIQDSMSQARDTSFLLNPFERQDPFTISFDPWWSGEKTLEKSEKVRIFSLKTHFDTCPYLVDRGEVHCISTKEEWDTDGRILAMCIHDLPGIVFLFVASSDKLMIIDQDPRLVNFLSYVIYSVNNEGKIALRNPASMLFLSSMPPVADGKLSASRHLVQDWEKFELVPFDEFRDSRIRLIEEFVNGNRDLKSFWSEQSEESLLDLCSVFPVLVSIADQTEVNKLRWRLGPLKRYVY